MPFKVECNNCHTSQVVDCICGPGVQGHYAGCPMLDLGATVICPPDTDCCHEDHSHDTAANGCPGAGLRHEGVACPHPDGGAGCLVVTPPGEPCPGGHCHVSLPDCTVCRPVTITMLAGSAMVTGG